MRKESHDNPKPTAKSGALEQLYELAKEEGEFVCNVGGGEDDPWKEVADIFSKRFPGVTPKFVTVGPTIGQRLLAEYEANKVSIDCSSTGMSAFIRQIERGLITRHDWTGFNVKEEDLFLDGLGVLLFDLAWIFFYNTELISPAEAPRTWEDLLNPRWKGKILILHAVNNATIPGIIWPKEKAETYIKALGKQSKPAARGRHIREKVASGEYLIGTGVLKAILKLQEAGIPVKALPFGPAYIIQQIFWTFERCPHPNAAKLLGAWLASDEGKETIKAMGNEKIEPLAASQQGRAMLEMGMELSYVKTIKDGKLRSGLGKRYAELMGFTTR
jgi:iron(III) transport system substrate-binding protein